MTLLVALLIHGGFVALTLRALWTRQALGLILVFGWLVVVCHVAVAFYLALLVYASSSLGLLRSFAEHRADRDVHRRTRVVEAGAFWSPHFPQQQPAHRPSCSSSRLSRQLSHEESWHHPGVSNSGMNLLRAAVAPLANGAAFFGSVSVSGSHRRSVELRVTGKSCAWNGRPCS